MSSAPDIAVVTATVALLDSFYYQKYCIMATSTLFIYEVIDTFDREVACFWTTKRSGASSLFFANKWMYLTVLVMQLVVYASFPSEKSCSMFTRAEFVVKLLQFIPGAGANLVPYGYDLRGENTPPFGCGQSDNRSTALDVRLVVISRGPLIIANILLIWITWTKLSRGALRSVQHKRLSLSDILFRGGIIYFVILFILNTLHLVFTVTFLAGSSYNEASLLSIFIAPITTILISRFLLELQESSQRVVRIDSDDPLHSSRDSNDTPSFILSLGGFIDPDLPAGSDADDDDGLASQGGSGSEVREEEDRVHDQASQAAAAPSSLSA
ncbi:hypothetical protein C8T65DRAFT_702085 [Cerioporus squamosus]|nr:hypothetical protein C8T65DRAFT_702085 [Cerioporus squamosus]